jgi:DNA-binding GntR family transcriptional regulator
MDPIQADRILGYNPAMTALPSTSGLAVRGDDPPRLAATSLPDEIAYRLQREILEGTIPLGTHLTQDGLCARFGVSRTPIREALLKLEASSLVALRPNRGAVVRTPGRREVQEVYELRAELEGFAAERAATRLDRFDLGRLQRAQEELAAIVTEPAAAGGEDRTRFAAALGAANDTVHDLTEAADGVDALTALNVDQHEELIAALAAADAPAARSAMSDHVAHAGHLLIDHLDRRRFWG